MSCDVDRVDDEGRTSSSRASSWTRPITRNTPDNEKKHTEIKNPPTTAPHHEPLLLPPESQLPLLSPPEFQLPELFPPQSQLPLLPPELPLFPQSQLPLLLPESPLLPQFQPPELLLPPQFQPPESSSPEFQLPPLLPELLFPQSPDPPPEDQSDPEEDPELAATKARQQKKTDKANQGIARRIFIRAPPLLKHAEIPEGTAPPGRGYTG